MAGASTFLANAGANIVSLDQHSTQQTGETFMQRTIFHLPGLAAARDALERDFAEPIAARSAGICASRSPPSRNGSPSWRRPRTTACSTLLWRNRRGELDMSVVMVIANHPDLADEERPFACPSFSCRQRKGIRDEAEHHQLDLLRGKVDLVVLARCRS